MKGNYKLSTSQTDLDNDTNTLFEIRCDMYVTQPIPDQSKMTLTGIFYPPGEEISLISNTQTLIIDSEKFKNFLSRVVINLNIHKDQSDYNLKNYQEVLKNISLTDKEMLESYNKTIYSLENKNSRLQSSLSNLNKKVQKLESLLKESKKLISELKINQAQSKIIEHNLENIYDIV